MYRTVAKTLRELGPDSENGELFFGWGAHRYAAGRLKAIKEQLPEEITYEMLRVALVRYR